MIALNGQADEKQRQKKNRKIDRRAHDRSSEFRS
jgi:hypothetical protein